MHYCRLLFHSSKYSQNMLISPEAQIAGELNFEKELYHVIIYFLFFKELEISKTTQTFFAPMGDLCVCMRCDFL